jgi:N-acetylneuraminic acid mutarotase
MSPTARWLAIAVPVGLAATAVAVALIADDDRADGDAGAARAVRWTALPPSPSARTEVGAARVGRSIYVVGGFVPPDLSTTDEAARYDVASGAWSPVAPLPIAVNHPAVAAGASRCGGAVYVYGGYSANGALSAEVDALQRFDPGTGRWTVLPGSGVPRGAATLVPVGCSLYAIGGVSAGAPQRLVQVFDIGRGVWRLGPSMRVAREHLAGVAIGRRVIVFGGRSSGHNLAVAESLDTKSGKWSRLPSVPTPRSGFGAAVIRGSAAVVGGEQLAEGTSTIAPVEALDPRTRRWRRLPSMLTPRHGLGVVSLGPRLFAVDGGPRPGGTYSDALETLRVPARLLPRAGGRFRQKGPG